MSSGEHTPDRSPSHPSEADHAWSELHELDAQALEALCEAGFDLERVDASMRARAECAASVLGLLERRDAGESPEDDAGTLIDVTLARVNVARRAGPVPQAEAALLPEDEDALELLIASGLRVERVPGGVRRRAAKHMQILNLLSVSRESHEWLGSESLVTATLGRVQSQADSQARRMRIEESPRGWRVRAADLVSVAALLLIAGAVTAPLAQSMREYGRRSSCESNLVAAGLGFGTYANDFRDALPLATRSPAGMPWWDVGNVERSNSANLFTLARTGYSKVTDLACAGNPTACVNSPTPTQQDWGSLDQVSYSYQNMFAHERTRWTQASTVVVVADRSPIIPLALRGQLIDPMSNSLNHAGKGQAVLMNDGAVRFIRTPVLENKDNIYLPRVIEQAIQHLQQPNRAKPLMGTESPAGADDVFLGP